MPGMTSLPASSPYIAAAAGRGRLATEAKTAAPSTRADRRSKFSIASSHNVARAFWHTGKLDTRGENLSKPILDRDTPDRVGSGLVAWRRGGCEAAEASASRRRPHGSFLRHATVMEDAEIFKLPDSADAFRALKIV